MHCLYSKSWMNRFNMILNFIFKSTCKIEPKKGNIDINYICYGKWYSWGSYIFEMVTAKRSTFHEAISRYTILLSPFRGFIGISSITRSRLEHFAIVSETTDTLYICLISELRTQNIKWSRVSLDLRIKIVRYFQGYKFLYKINYKTTIKLPKAMN